MNKVKFREILSIPLKNGLNRPTKVRGSGISMVNMGELFSNGRIHDIVMELVEVQAKENHYLLEYGDLLFARQSLVKEGAGKCSIFLGSEKPTTFEGHIIRARLDRSKADPLFYYYYFKSEIGKLNMSRIVEQVAAAGIRGSDLAELEIPYIPLKTQREIAHILGTLDDKIELNRKMSKTLEEMAQTLYKHWFIDFEFPNEEGKPYKSSGGEMIDSELGPIPKGWKVGYVSDLAIIVGGGTPSTKEPKYWGGDIPFVTPKDLSSISSYYLYHTDRSVTKVGAECISSGVLPEDTILLSSRAPIGYTAFLTKPSIINQGFIACKCVQPYYMGYLFLWIRNNIENIKLYANGSTFMEINKDNFKRISVLLPPNRLLVQFSNDLLPLLSSIKHLFDTNSLLGETHVRLKSSFFQSGK